jgi:hypothetical protein
MQEPTRFDDGYTFYKSAELLAYARSLAHGAHCHECDKPMKLERYDIAVGHGLTHGARLYAVLHCKTHHYQATRMITL